MCKTPKIICVTGGKGGTGKTLVAVNLATMFKNEGYKVLLLDGDCENPNTHLLLGKSLENKSNVKFFIPRINEENCTRCGLCATNCMPHALLHIENSIPIPILTVCSGCKLCYKICPESAIEQDFKIIGNIYEVPDQGLDLMVGELKTGEARSAAIIEEMMERLDSIMEAENHNYDIIIFDTAPGAHCDVEHLIEKADHVIPVTEPTRFGYLDLIRIIELIELMGKDYRVIVNRSSLSGYKKQFMEDLKKDGIEILGEIPLDNEIVKSYCRGKPLMDQKGNSNTNGLGYRAFVKIYENLKEYLSIKND